MKKESKVEDGRRVTDSLQQDIQSSIKKLEEFIQLRLNQVGDGPTGFVVTQSLINLQDFVQRSQVLSEQVKPTLDDLKVLKEALAQVANEVSNNKNLPNAIEKLSATMSTVDSMISKAEARHASNLAALREELAVGDLSLADLDRAMEKAVSQPKGSDAQTKGEASPKSTWVRPVIPKRSQNPPVSRHSGWSDEDSAQESKRVSLKRASTGPDIGPEPKRPASICSLDWSRIERKIKAVESTVKGSPEFEAKIQKLRGIAEKLSKEPASYSQINKMLDSLVGQYGKSQHKIQQSPKKA